MRVWIEFISRVMMIGFTLSPGSETVYFDGVKIIEKQPVFRPVARR